ncbi:LuxR C-terminal-related transcriptional regulator [Streptacidiphilus cavernicola]|uniref:LuxR C-terminal-related transcriptional regulator n=1 Tax=Streptacidiphilus cavernicola TaxID=3342716 RepID=A0ABV6VYR9_9ACTN
MLAAHTSEPGRSERPGSPPGSPQGRSPGPSQAISSAEEAVYVELCRRGPTSLAELARALELDQVTVLQQLTALDARALARPPRPRSAPSRWTAVAPDLALQRVLRDREAESARLHEEITRLLDDYHRSRGDRDPALRDLVEVVTGREAIADLWLCLLDGAAEQVDILDKPPFVQVDNAGPELAVLGRGVPVRSVYERAALLQPDKLDEVRGLVGAGEQAGTVADLPFKLALVDRRWALLPLATGAELSRALLVRPSPLLDALTQTFDAQWAQSLPVPTPDRQPDADHFDLLTLLAAGMTDDGIARHLGISARTVQRRVSALMTGLSAGNRFQAGVQAARRGLL